MRRADIHTACGGTNEERKWALANYSFSGWRSEVDVTWSF
jgi:hypothetical protein